MTISHSSIHMASFIHIWLLLYTYLLDRWNSDYTHIFSKSTYTYAHKYKMLIYHSIKSNINRFSTEIHIQTLIVLAFIIKASYFCYPDSRKITKKSRNKCLLIQLMDMLFPVKSFRFIHCIINLLEIHIFD